MELPVWVGIVLLFLSLASFLPQLRLLWARRDSSGISLYYVLINLIIATENFTISLLWVVHYRFEKYFDRVFVHLPITVGDYLNLAHFTLVWVVWFVIFAACLVYSPGQTRKLGHRIAASVIYFAFLLISAIPMLYDAAFLGPYHSRHVFGLWLLFLGPHVVIIVPGVTILGFVALCFQACTMMKRPPGSGHGALSLEGLGAQAVVFALLGFSWLGRISYPWEERADWERGGLEDWYQFVGFVFFDHVIFAFAQTVLLCLAIERGRQLGQEQETLGREERTPGTPASETDPLLGG